MTTLSTNPVTRETNAYVRDRGVRPIIATISGSVLTLRAKGLRTRETLDFAHLYELAVKQRVIAERAEKRALKRKRK